MSVWSVNAHFPEAGEPFAVYECVVDYSVSGQRLNPLNLSQRIEFSVDGNSSVFENRSVALYSERELRFFLVANRELIESGVLVPSSGRPKSADPTNAIDDEEVLRIASIRSPQELELELQKFTEKLPVQRILAEAEHLGRSQRIISVIKKRLESYDRNTDK